MSWMLAVPPSQVLPLKSAVRRGASVACDDCGVVFVRRHHASVIFASVADAIASATTFCEGWTYKPSPGDGTGAGGRLRCLDCVLADEASALVEVRPVHRHDVIPSTVVRRRDECDEAGS